jgi:recombination protein RecT
MSSVKTAANGQIVKPEAPAAQTSKKSLTLSAMLLEPKMQREIARALPEHIKPDRMIRVLLTALKTTPKLAQCETGTFLGCIMQAAQLGLEPNTPLGHAYLIPRDNRKTRETRCTLLIGYQGMLELSYRTGAVIEVGAQVVRRDDEFEYEYGLRPKLRFRPSPDALRDLDPDRFPITHVWAKAEMKSGGQPWVVLSRAQVEARRARSMASETGPWVTDYEAMCQKTAVRALWKFLPKSTEMAQAEALEQAAESGHSQLSVLSDDVKEALMKQGLVSDEDLEPEALTEGGSVDEFAAPAESETPEAP